MDPQNGTSETGSASSNDDSVTTLEHEATNDASSETSTESQETSSQEDSGSREPISAALNEFARELGRPETTPAAPAKKEGEEAPVEAPAAPVPQHNVVSPRKLEGLNEEEAEWFKRMGNKAYTSLYPWYIESKGLKEQLSKAQGELQKVQGTAFYEHEGAFRLDPNYEKLAKASSRIEAEAAYWQDQLAIVESGGDFTPLRYNNETGEYQYDEPVKGSPQIKAEILSSLSKAHNLHQRIQGEMGSFENNFKTQHQTYKSGIEATRNKIIGQLSAADKANLEKAVATKLPLFPEHMRGRQEVRIAAELMVINEGLLKIVQKLQGDLKGRNVVSRTTRSAGPVAANTGAGGATETVGSVLKEFNQAGFSH